MNNGDIDFQILKNIGDNAIVRCHELINRGNEEFYPNENVYENALYEAFKNCKDRIHIRFKDLQINTDSLGNFSSSMMAAYVTKEIIKQKPIERVERTAIFSLSKGKRERIKYIKAWRENYLFAIIFSLDIVVQSQIFRYTKSEEDCQAIMDELVEYDSPNRIYTDEMVDELVEYIINLSKKLSNDNFLFVLALAEIYDVLYNIFYAPVMRRMAILHITK